MVVSYTGLFTLFDCDGIIPNLSHMQNTYHLGAIRFIHNNLWMLIP